MASEIRVNKIENRSGLGTVTFADTGVDLAGIVTATTFSGSGASLTNVPDSALSAVTASKLTGALPAISGASLTGMASTENVRTGILDVAGISTFRNTMNVGAAVTISESGIEASGIGITCANINGGAIGGRKNLIINGDMRIAQRGTSFTSHPSYAVDRFRWGFSNHSAGTITVSQQSLSSSDTPYTLGFRKYTRMALGQAGTAAANTAINLTYKAEAQDIATSGWNYTSTSSFITISFWFRCSTNQTFVGEFQSKDGTAQAFTFTFTASGNNAWTKITKTIPGDSNIQIDNDNGAGLDFRWYPFYGTNYSTSGHTLEQWGAYSGSDIVPDMASTWLTAGASTFDVTGVQLEVGSQATAFEHRNFGDELLLCQRYFCTLTTRTDDNSILGQGMYYGDTQIRCPVRSYVEMRSHPTVETTNSTNHFTAYAKGSGVNFPTFDSSHQECPSGIVLGATITDNDNNGAAAYVVATYDASTGLGVVSLNAEL